MSPIPRLLPLRHVRTGHLDVAYFEAGPADGPPVLLLHGFPYDIHSYVEVAPILADAGFRVIVPSLRGHGDTRFVDETIPRTGQQAALGQDVIELMDALRIPRAILAGYDWGGRAACVVAALWPERVTALVSVNGYLIQDISAAMQPIRPDLEAGFWYFFYFLTDRGRAGLTENRRGIAEVIWRRNSPEWDFSDAELDRAAAAFENPRLRRRRDPLVPAPPVPRPRGPRVRPARGAAGAAPLDHRADHHPRWTRRRQLPCTRCGNRRGPLRRALRASTGAARRPQPAAGGTARIRGCNPQRGGTRGAAPCRVARGRHGTAPTQRQQLSVMAEAHDAHPSTSRVTLCHDRGVSTPGRAVHAPVVRREAHLP